MKLAISAHKERGREERLTHYKSQN